jgi:hypothetical protein
MGKTLLRPRPSTIALRRATWRVVGVAAPLKARSQACATSMEKASLAAGVAPISPDSPQAGPKV